MADEISASALRARLMAAREKKPGSFGIETGQDLKTLADSMDPYLSAAATKAIMAMTPRDRDIWFMIQCPHCIQRRAKAVEYQLNRKKKRDG